MCQCRISTVHRYKTSAMALCMHAGAGERASCFFYEQCNVQKRDLASLGLVVTTKSAGTSLCRRPQQGRWERQANRLSGG